MLCYDALSPVGEGNWHAALPAMGVDFIDLKGLISVG